MPTQKPPTRINDILLIVLIVSTIIFAGLVFIAGKMFSNPEILP